MSKLNLPTGKFNEGVGIAVCAHSPTEICKLRYSDKVHNILLEKIF